MTEAPSPSPSRDEAMLAEIAERDFALACRTHDAAMACEPQQLPELSRAYQRATRSLRQTLALKARLAGDVAERRRKAAQRAQAEHAARIRHRQDQVAAPLERAIWDEHEDPDCAERELDRLDQLLDELALADDFLDAPLETLIQRLAARLGYDAEIIHNGSAPAAPQRALNTADTS